jgi:hypothetical protein
MNRKNLVLAGALGTIGALGLASIGFAAAQTGDNPDGSGMHGTMSGAGQMGNHAAMAGDMPMDEMGDMASGDCSGQQSQMHEAVASALGMTVAELDSQLASGKTIADIARDKGVDLATVHAAMQGLHSAGHGSGMMHSGMSATN